MSDPNPNRTPVPPRRVFGGAGAGAGAGDSALDVDDASPVRRPAPPARRPSAPGPARVSFSTSLRRPSFARWRSSNTLDEEAGGAPKPERPAIPSALQPPPEAYATPLPRTSMVVLSISMLGEFLCANVSAPFLLFMVESFDQFENEADVGYWTGILVSTFFLTQFLTSLLWATVAAKHGQRLVVGISLLGSAITCVLFGTSKTIQQAMAIRLAQGVFAGAIGVARGTVASITDPSNEGRAYAILGFSWGLGGVAGAIVGGSFENPATKWAGSFGKIALFVEYPYLLPCMVASSVTLTGSILSLFLGPDCGPRQGTIRLPLEKNTDVSTIPEESPPVSPSDESREQAGFIGSIGRKVGRKFSGVFASRVPEESPAASASIPVPLASTAARPRGFSRGSAAAGSAYGYNGSYRARLASHGTLAPSISARRASMAASYRRRESNANAAAGDPMVGSYASGADLNFAQRLLMANENGVTNIADLWVAAAINVDNEEVFEDEEPEDWEDAPGASADRTVTFNDEDAFDAEADTFDYDATPRNNRFIRRPSMASTSIHPSTSRGPADARRPSHSNMMSPSASGLDVPQTPARRYSTTTAPIFAHVGVRTPPAVVEAQKLLALADEQEAAAAAPPLASITEDQRLSQIHHPEEPAATREPSLMSQLPLMIIFQYGVLALHSTTHDQVFYLYLVSKYPSGGLNLNAGHFSQLIALMCLAQIVYQFYFYPNIGPPRGRFSHLAMFRIGSLLYIPAYLSVTLYRVFASADDDGNFILMCALAISTAIRFCAITFSYTAVAVLLNYMSPPHIVGYANGIAQSCVSLARFCGPVLGGLMWSVSVKDNPSGYAFGFLVCSTVCALAVAQSFFIR